MKQGAPAKVLERTLLEALAIELRPLQFLPYLSQQEFKRREMLCTWVVHVSFIRHPHDVDLTVDLGVSLSQVDRLLVAAGWNQTGGATIGVELGNLIDMRPQRWTIETEGTAFDLAEQIVAEVRKFGLDWLSRFSQLENVYRAIAPNNQQSWLIMPLHVKRCLVAVALACLLGTKEEAQARVSEYRAFLQARKDPMLPIFERHANALIAL